MKRMIKAAEDVKPSKTLNTTKPGMIVCYIDTVNYRGEVTDRQEVARFRNQAWARQFIKWAEPQYDNENGLTRFVVKEI